MWRVLLVPVVISFLLLAAHFLRAGMQAAMILCLVGPFLLLIKKPAAARIVQVMCLLGTAEWLRTLYDLVKLYQGHGLDWTRMAVILGGVALFTAASAMVFFLEPLRRQYKWRNSGGDIYLNITKPR